MNYLQAIILGLIQGVTEFLPISSSGHLLITNKLLGLQPNISFSVILHAASLLAVVIYFRQKIFKISGQVFSKSKSGYLYAGYLLIGIIPAVIAGLFFEDLIDQKFNSLTVVGVFLIINSLILFIGERNQKEDHNLNSKNSFGIGLTQILALLPGISRSGSTISAGLVLGLKRKEAIEFSFLMAIPLILGAVVLKLDDMISQQLFTSYTLIGFLTSFISSWLAIDIMISRLKSFKVFSIYTLILGISCLLFKMV